MPPLKPHALKLRRRRQLNLRRRWELKLHRRWQLALWISTAIPLLLFVLILAFDRQNLRSVAFLTLAVSVPVLQSLLFAGFLDKLRRDLRNANFWYFFYLLLNVSCTLTTIFTVFARPSLHWRAGLFGGYIAWGFCVDQVFGLPNHHSVLFCLQSLAVVRQYVFGDV